MKRLKSTRKYLVFSSTGDHGQVHSWLSKPNLRSFDVVLYYYGNEQPPAVEADYIEVRKGLKFQNFVHFLGKYEISNYEAIWIVDDDIILETEAINRMFKVFFKYQLLLAQPSFKKGGKTPWKITINNPSCLLRYTNFIEVNSCVVSPKIVLLLLNSFKDAGTGFGVDFIWPQLLDYPENRIAVIDEIVCEHPKSEFSEIDQVVPRQQQKIQGIKLLQKYGLLPPDYSIKDWSPFWKYFHPREYSRVVKFSE